MKKSTIQLLVTVDIWHDANFTRNQAIKEAKGVVLLASSSYAIPKSSELYRKPKLTAHTTDRAAGGECCEWEARKTETNGTQNYRTGCQRVHSFMSNADCPYCGKPIHVKES